MNRTKDLCAAAVVALTLGAQAQSTTVAVPQGSAVFPVMGQIECLEDERSRSRCAATWRCADGSEGELWDDMTHGDGRRPIPPDHEISVGRQCELIVDGAAAATWFRGYRADERSVVGLAPAQDAQRPVRVVQRSGGTTQTLLDYVLSVEGLTIPQILVAECGHIAEGHKDRLSCEQLHLRSIVKASSITLTSAVRCAVDRAYL